MTKDEQIDDVLRCLLAAQDCFLDPNDSLKLREEPDIEQAMLEMQIALIRMRRMVGGKEATENLINRAKAEIERRKMTSP